MKLRTDRSTAENARAVLPKMAKKYFEAGRQAVHPKAPPSELHRFRIATKRFRYTLELFQPVYGPGLKRYVHALRGLQSTLGDISDNQSIAALLASDKALQAQLQRGVRHKLRQLRREWSAFDSEGELERWKAYLARIPARSRAAKGPPRAAGR